MRQHQAMLVFMPMQLRSTTLTKLAEPRQVAGEFGPMKEPITRLANLCFLELLDLDLFALALRREIKAVLTLKEWVHVSMDLR